MKRTWITVKRGILEPKHRFALGELIWLYIYILDLTNWEAGIIEEWLDRGAAEEMEMPLSTLIDQRRKLEKKGYITCERKQHGIRVIVHNWTNPREYTGKKYNEKIPVNTLDDTPVNTLEVETPSHESVPSYSQKSKIINDASFVKPSKEEPILVPCDQDGIPDDWKETKVKKSPISENEQRLAQLIADSLGIKPPICNSKKEYAAAQVTWWKPIKEMLRQVDQNIQEAESIADCAIDDYRKAKLTITSPKSVLSGFIAVIVREKNGH